MQSRRRVCGLWLATCERANVKDLHLHDLRGEVGSQLLEAGVPIHEVPDALGHSSTTTTSTYLRTRTSSLTKAYERRTAHRAATTLTGHKTRSVFDRYDIVNEADLQDGLRRLADAQKGTFQGHSTRKGTVKRFRKPAVSA